MVRHICLLLILTVVTSFCAQSSGIYFCTNVSRGKMKGDTLYHFEGTNIGIIDGDSIRFTVNGKQMAVENKYIPYSSYPVDFQYAVQYSFVAGYEKSINSKFSVRGAMEYQKVLLDAYGAKVTTDMMEEPFVSAKINRHRISVPVDFKVTLPIRRSGIYLAVGPKASILLSSKYTDSLTNTTENLTDITPRFNLGIGFRIGAELAIAKIGYLLLESGYHKGLLNTSHISSANTQEGEIVPLGIGFRISIP